jgi:cell division septation protein DedD
MAQAARLADGTAVRVRLTADLLSSQAAVGARVDMEIAQPVMLQGGVAIPQGAVVWGAVQDVKKGKSLHFDVEGVRLPNQQTLKLRCSAHKTSNAAKDEIKVETQVSGDLGAAKGTEFTAYLDQDVDVEVAGAPAPAPAQPAPVVAPAPAPQPATPVPAPVATPAPAAVTPPTPPAETPPAKPAPVAAPPVASAPVAPAPTPAPHPATAAQPAEYITVECFSDPTGADIMIDDEFHGSTPSILKLLPGNHQIEFRLMGYKAHSQPLNLSPGSGLRTVRMTLEKQ